MKIKIILVVAILLTSCQPMVVSTPEIQEVTRIVEQTVEIPIIVKETIIVTQVVNEPTPTPTKFWDRDYNLPSHYFDAMLVVVKFYAFWETKQCEAYYDLFSEWGKPQNSKEDQIKYCLDPENNIELISVAPYNYNLVSEGRNPLMEPEDLIFFEVDIKETYKGYEHSLHSWVSVVFEDDEWKIGKGGTSPPMYGSEYWNR